MPSTAVDPAAVVLDREHDLAPVELEGDGDVSPPCSSAFERSSEKTSASAVARCPASSTGSSSAVDLLARDEALHEHRTEPVDELGEIDDVLPVLGQLLVHGGDREDPVDGVAERLLGVDAVRARLEAEQRRNGLEVVLDPVVDLLGEDAAQSHPAVLERDGGLIRDGVEQLPVVVGERRVAIDDELADRAAAPAQRKPDGMGARLPFRPGDAAVFEHERRAGGAERLDRGADDRLERLLEVERLRDRLGDARQRLQLLDAAASLRVELGMLDRLADLRGDRREETDLGLA